MNQPSTKRRNQRFAMSRWYQARNPSHARRAAFVLAGGGSTPLSTAVSALTMESDWSARPSTYSASSRSPSFIERITASLAKSNEFTSAVSGPILSTRPEPAEQEEQHHEEDVHDGHGRLEEVVVVRGDELAELVEEEAEPDAGGEGREEVPEATLHGHEEDEGQQHADAAPEQVGEVDLAAAQLRPAGGGEDDAHQQDGGHGGDEEELEVVHGRDPPHEVEPLAAACPAASPRRPPGRARPGVRRSAHAGYDPSTLIQGSLQARHLSASATRLGLDAALRCR